MAALIMETLDSAADPSVARFQSLIERKYTRGLTSAETAELHRLELEFRKSDGVFYEPVLARAARETAAPQAPKPLASVSSRSKSRRKSQ